MSYVELKVGSKRWGLRRPRLGTFRKRGPLGYQRVNTVHIGLPERHLAIILEEDYRLGDSPLLIEHWD